ncbi:MAG TPA: methyltransferase domain-containing protein [Thermoanaerobaculia bacterium]|nr:methyltransferase domain-containing protein [Thermoanaerobaculia bacterium]
MTVTLLCTVRECRTPLALEERRYVCARGHSFDIARSGYVNLLQPQDRRSNSPGDSREAVNARRRFLDRGFATPLVRAIVELLPMRSGEAFLDAGCGEGTHTAAFRDAYTVEAHGTDISLPAIELAAKRHTECHWTIANADRFLPYADGSFAGVASITARLSVDEFARVLAPDGTLLVVIPGADDLIELRAAMQGEAVERDRVQRTIEMFAPRFTLVRHERLAHVATLDREAIADVLASSYRGFRMREQERLAVLDALDVTLSRDALLFAIASALRGYNPAPCIAN